MSDDLTINGVMPGSGRCVVEGCDVRCGSMLMCRPHWFAVPRALRRNLTQVLGRWMAGDATLDELRAAQQACADEVTAGG